MHQRKSEATFLYPALYRAKKAWTESSEKNINTQNMIQPNTTFAFTARVEGFFDPVLFPLVVSLDMLSFNHVQRKKSNVFF